MNFILTGMLLSSLVTSTHDTREACEGRAVLLREKGVLMVQCHDQRPTFSTNSNQLILR